MTYPPAKAHYPDLAGRKALVTGASSGIGRAVAEALLAEGASVALHYHRNAGAAEAIAAAHPGRAFAVQADLATEAGCAKAVAEAARALGGLGDVVHSAGAYAWAPLPTLDAAALHAMFALNVYAGFFLCREALPLLGEAPRGHVVFIGSTAGERGETSSSAYAASKGAVQSMVLSLAHELAPRVRVNLVSPGWVRTPMSAPAMTPARERSLNERLPNGRIAEADDVAQATLWLLSEASAHVLGHDLGVSGGALLPLVR